jgi:hypothetical protein
MEASQQPPVEGEPTLAQAIEIAKAAQQAAAEVREENDELRKEMAGKAAAEEAEAQGVTLSKGQQEEIANMTVSKMEELGAFGPPEGEGGEGGEGGSTALAQGVDQAAGGSPQPPAGEGANGGPAADHPQPPAGGVDAPPEEPPQRKTLAERFQGR